jgi:hypothetical protein
MHNTYMTETAAHVSNAHRTQLRRFSPSEQFLRALHLSAYVRQLAWQGAVRHSGAQGENATAMRFLTQLYGADVATAFGAARDLDHE